MKRILPYFTIFILLMGCKKEPAKQFVPEDPYFNFVVEGKTYSYKESLVSSVSYSEDGTPSLVMYMNKKPGVECVMQLTQLKLGSYTLDGTNKNVISLYIHEINPDKSPFAIPFQTTHFAAGLDFKDLANVILNITTFEQGFIGGNLKGSVLTGWEEGNPKKVSIEGTFLVKNNSER